MIRKSIVRIIATGKEIAVKPWSDEYSIDAAGNFYHDSTYEFVRNV